MSIEENKALVRRYCEELWNQNQLAVADECLAADAVIHFDGPGSDFPFTPAVQQQVVTAWRTAFPDFQYIIEDLLADGDRVVANTRQTGTHTGVFRWMFVPRQLWTIEPTGKRLDEREIMIFRVADGKIVEMWAAFDQLNILDQLAVLEQLGDLQSTAQAIA